MIAAVGRRCSWRAACWRCGQLHGRARHDHRQRLGAAHRRRPGRLARRRAPGSSPPMRWPRRSRVPLTGWLAARFGTVRVFIARHGRLRHLSRLLCGLAPVARHAGRLFRILQGLCRRAADAAVADPAAAASSRPKQRPTAMGALGDDHPGRADPRADPRRQALRQRRLAVDLLHQRAGRDRLLASSAGALLKRQETETAQDARSTSSACCLLIVWVGALQLMLDIGKDHDWFDSPLIVVLAIVAVRRLRRLPDLGADRGEPDRRPARLPAPGLHAPRW